MPQKNKNKNKNKTKQKIQYLTNSPSKNISITLYGWIMNITSHMKWNHPTIRCAPLVPGMLRDLWSELIGIEALPIQFFIHQFVLFLHPSK